MKTSDIIVPQSIQSKAVEAFKATSREAAKKNGWLALKAKLDGATQNLSTFFLVLFKDCFLQVGRDTGKAINLFRAACTYAEGEGKAAWSAENDGKEITLKKLNPAWVQLKSNIIRYLETKGADNKLMADPDQYDTLNALKEASKAHRKGRKSEGSGTGSTESAIGFSMTAPLEVAFKGLLETLAQVPEALHTDAAQLIADTVLELQALIPEEQTEAKQARKRNAQRAASGNKHTEENRAAA